MDWPRDSLVGGGQEARTAMGGYEVENDFFFFGGSAMAPP